MFTSQDRPAGTTAGIEATPAKLASGRVSEALSPGHEGVSSQGAGSFAPTLPSITKPTGGGAIRGLGERIDIAHSTGAVRLEVPLSLPPGRSGFSPSLQLSYSTSAGGSTFGLGWQLSLPVITRRTAKGVPNYGLGSPVDVYQLAGEDDLIPTAGETKKDDPSLKHGEWSITRYRPRNENYSVRVEHWRNHGVADDPGHWRVIRADNSSHIFGFHAAHRVANPDDPRQVFSWLLEESRDDKGNVILYRYKAEDGDGEAASLLHARHRWSKGEYKTSAQRYLKSVMYANTVPADTVEGSRFGPSTLDAMGKQLGDWCYQVVFDYGEHDELSPSLSELRPWSIRPDPFSDYRAGFEVRTLRLCERVLVFQRIPSWAETDSAMTETGDWSCVREHVLRYQSKGGLSLLESFEQVGLGSDAFGNATRNLESALPPLTFRYSEASEPVFRSPDPTQGPWPQGEEHQWVGWVDLDGEGAPGLLWRSRDSMHFRSAVSQAAQGRHLAQSMNTLGPLRMGPIRQVGTVPNGMAGALEDAVLTDVDGDGRLDLIGSLANDAGFWSRTPVSDDWAHFRAFESTANFTRSNPRSRWIDLTGDGLADILITGTDDIFWLKSKGAAGFEQAVRRLDVPHEPGNGPAAVFADGTETLFIADMSGDGLMDLVRIRNGSVIYWPNLGHGRFGAPVVMSDAPVFDRPDAFDPRRVRLADVDGSGTTDILYLRPDRVDVFGNLAGNGWKARPTLRTLPQWGPQTRAELQDIFGNGTSCLVWSMPCGHLNANSLLVLDLTGGIKPHLLTATDNGHGGVTELSYSTSARECLTDKAEGRPWHTRVPFPVQVVKEIRRLDMFAQTERVTRYRYHHGYFDGSEREFRGFAFVEETDSDSLLPATDARGSDDVSWQPPALTRRWFHTGAWLEGVRLEALLEREHWVEPHASSAFRLPPPLLTAGSNGQERVDCARALAGKPLRIEVYGLDGTTAQHTPLSIKAWTYRVEVRQAQQGPQPAAVQALEWQTAEWLLERNPQEPRVHHSLVLDSDELGFALRKVDIAYGRPMASERSERVNWVAVHEQRYGHLTGSATAFRTGLPTAQWLQAAWNIAMPSEGLIGESDLLSALDRAQALPPGVSPGEVAQLQLVTASLLEYWNDAHPRSAEEARENLPLGQSTAQGLVRREWRLAFTQQVLERTLGTRRLLGIDLATEGGYQSSDALKVNTVFPFPLPGWWAPSNELDYDRDRFFLPTSHTDPFGAITRYAHDQHALHLVNVTDPFGNETRVTYDYRALAPALVTDANLNRTAFRFDANARLVAMALMGKERGSDGDTLEAPSAEFVYQLRQPGQPLLAGAREREQHRAPDSRWRETYTYTDGSGREILRKTRAEAGPVPQRDASGKPLLDGRGRTMEQDVSERWVGSGRIVYNNRGNPVRQYEPYFSDNPGFESEAGLRQWGVSSLVTYDPLDRPIRTDFPDGGRQETRHFAWSIEHWDEGDLVNESSWAERSLQSRPENVSQASMERAVQLSRAYAGSPRIERLDALGRPWRETQDNGPRGAHQLTQLRDLVGQVVSVADATERAVGTTAFDLLGRPLHDWSADAGDKFFLHAADGAPLRQWTGRGHTLRYRYDRLRRQTQLWVTDPAGEPPDATGPPPEPPEGEAPDEPGGLFGFLRNLASAAEVDDDGPAPRRGSERLVHRAFYGESIADPAFARRLNLMGKLRREFDGAGVQSFSYDFHGQRVNTARRLRLAYRWQPDWSALAGDALDPDAALGQVLSELEEGTYEVVQRLDALGRLVLETHPDKTEIRPQYGEGGLLDALQARPRGAGPWVPVVSNIDYNARGQRVRVAYGNGVTTRYSYEPGRFRLRELRSWRPQGGESRPIQHKVYVHDAVGNIVEIDHRADDAPLIKGHVVGGGQRFEYDALSQLVLAEGRELPGYPPDASDPLGSRLPHRADLQALVRYEERFEYDRNGNLLKLDHRAGATRWSRRHTHDPLSNRLMRSEASGSPAADYAYDAGGNLLVMPHLPQMRWDAEGRLASVDRAAGARVWMSYDAQGQRVRKVHRHGQRVEERVYLGPYEIYRRRRVGSATVRVERSTSHLMDGAQRVAMLETLTRDDSDAVGSPAPRWRYQLNDHLGSGCIELDEAAKLISFEEFHAFGTAAVAAQGLGEVSGRRYRYTGKERDEETGLNYHGARYMAPWLARWISPDPVGRVDGVNVYAYVRNNPVRHVDRRGQWAEDLAIGLPSLAMGVYSLVDNVKQGNVKDAVIDTIGVVADAAAIALPGVPGGAGYAVKATRAVEVLQKVDKAAQAYSAAESAYKNGSEAVDRLSSGDKGGAMESAGRGFLAITGTLLSAKSKVHPSEPKLLGVTEAKAPKGSRPDFVVTPKGTAMPTNKDINLVDAKKPGDWFQIHNTHTDAKAPGISHTHFPQQHHQSKTREIKTTTASDIDKADSLLRSGQMRERLYRGDTGGPMK